MGAAIHVMLLSFKNYCSFGKIMQRAFILLFDSFGLGASQDAVKYGDVGADTFGHIVEYCAAGKADKVDLRQGPIQIPNLTRLGLGMAALASTGKKLPGIDYEIAVTGAYGYAAERSLGKDTPSGHWEIAGVPVLFEWGYFPPEYPSFPQPLIEQLVNQGHLPGILGNKHASGTEIIEELGEEHMRSGMPIVYTSADSVFQIAAHEETFGLERLYELCALARQLVDKYNIGRVIARPFIGKPGSFKRTGNRRDIATPPPSTTLLDKIIAQAGEVIAIGKTADIFAHQGISKEIKATGLDALFDATLATFKTAPDRSLIFTNFVDFDSSYGHRRDVAGYAAALEGLDKRLPEFEQLMQPGDIAIITADHGCDPTWPGSDHTREHIPFIMFGPGITPRFIGRRESFADIGQTIAKHLGITELDYGIAC
ncbi:MAG: deoB [Gammaproteobacteria bacterium]|jgi:phosphopentomutase|nr:deoB [Gammaproteobacteria bacterium]